MFVRIFWLSALNCRIEVKGKDTYFGKCAVIMYKIIEN